jgi:TonB-dependent starch-binding outer membrane protein SusC
VHANAQQQEDSLQVLTFGKIITADNFQNVFNSEILSSISGRVAGVSISRKGSDPNHFSNVYIRGKSSAFNILPLYVIDGIWDADPNFLIPGEVESMEILKDAASTAIYGSRGMNGVIIINTRSYQGNRPFSLDFNSYASLNKAAGRMDLLSAGELRSFAEKNNILNFVDGQADTDWQDEIFRNTVSRVYNISANGLVKNTRYRVAFNHLDYPGIVVGTDRKISSMNIRLNQSALDDKLILGIAASIGRGESNRNPHYSGNNENNVFHQAFRRNPTDPVHEADGVTYAQSNRVFKYYNPLPIIENTTDAGTTQNHNLSLNSTYRITNGLHLRLNAGYASSDIERNYHIRPEAIPHGISEIKNRIITDFDQVNIQPGISFSRWINRKHKVDVYAGNNYLNVDRNYSAEYLTEFYERNEQKILNHNYRLFFANISYEFSRRYFINILLNNETYKFNQLVFRHESFIEGVESSEGASTGPVKHNNNYPALIGGWHIYNEPFMEGIPVISNLTIKGGYGYTGNNIYQTAYFHAPWVDIDDIEIERMGELNLELLFGLFENRLGGSLMYYKRDTRNALYLKQLPVPPSSQLYTYANESWFSNKGFEIELNALAVNSENLIWNSFICYSSNSNEWSSPLDAHTGHIDYYAGGSSNYTQLTKAGSPPVVFYLPVFAGLTEDGIELFQAETGVTREIFMAKREMMGQPVPKKELGWINRLFLNQRYELEFGLKYVTGHSIFNATRMAMSNPAFVVVQNVTHEGVRNYEEGRMWTSISDLYLEDASYLRLENITFTYKVVSGVFNPESSMRLYLSANNLFTLTNFSGFDPAYDYSGIDYFNVYPLARSFVFGIQLTI